MSSHCFCAISFIMTYVQSRSIFTTFPPQSRKARSRPGVLALLPQLPYSLPSYALTALHLHHLRYFFTSIHLTRVATMSSELAKGPMEQNVTALNFIYACSICCTSFADVYEGKNETVRGLSDGINPKERIVTRLFLSNCCHVFCSNHLEGGGKQYCNAI
jgi:hypothetical protein